ncbi:MAG: hypothetical protein HY858_04600 [Candidatus Solibacter usitatus]|nr:hypothetical protein [Candidatus Solibacter usitatus]
MPENFRRFSVTDPFGRVWVAEFRWQQNAISIRHADAIDCKYYLTGGDEQREIVVALPHAGLVAAAAEAGREVTDAWCLRVAGLHLEQMIRTWEDMDKTIVTVPPGALTRYAAALAGASRAEQERALNAH